MRSVDTSVLLYALNADCPEHAQAKAVLDELAGAEDVVLLDLVLVELYLLLRNGAVLDRPLTAIEAQEICVTLRQHPTWRIAEQAPVMDRVWRLARGTDFPRRRIIDARLALTALHHGVREWITRNVDDFAGFGFARLTNPFD